MELVYIAGDGTEKRIHGVGDLARAVENGDITADTLVRRSDSDRWGPAHATAEFQRARDLVDVAADRGAAQRPDAPAPEPEVRPAGTPKPLTIEVPDEREQWRPVVRDAGRLVRAPKRAFYATLGFAGMLVATYAYGAWYMRQMENIVQSYGWGRVPPDAFAVAPTTFDGLMVLGGVVGAIGTAISFLVTMGCIRASLVRLGVMGMRHSFGWTVGSMFIPLWNLYRPWVGFAEIRRAAMGCARRGGPSTEWVHDGFGWQTLLFGITVVVVQVTDRVLGKELERLAPPANAWDFHRWVSDYQGFMMGGAAVSILYVVAFALYARPAVRAVESLADRAVERRT